jgi:hypothetical protein
METQSPLVRLVLFMFCLALAGTIIAGVHYYVVDLPAQKAVQPPDNNWCYDQCNTAYFNCVSLERSVASTCTNKRDSCMKDCEGKTYSWIKTNP